MSNRRPLAGRRCFLGFGVYDSAEDLAKALEILIPNSSPLLERVRAILLPIPSHGYGDPVHRVLKRHDVHTVRSYGNHSLFQTLSLPRWQAIGDLQSCSRLPFSMAVVGTTRCHVDSALNSELFSDRRSREA